MIDQTIQLKEEVDKLKAQLAEVTRQRDEAFKAGFDLVVHGRAGDTPGLDVYWEEAQVRLGEAIKASREC